jgi:hypothetical protein
VITLDQLPERILNHTEPQSSSGCWLWTGSCDSGGYPLTGVRHLGVHRALYEMYIGGIEEGFHIHHRCGNKRCINPNHLEQLSGYAHRHLRAERTHCKNGHEYAVDGFWLTKGGYRICKVCARLRLGQDPRGGHTSTRQTHCKRGHEFTKENTTWLNDGRHRVCRKCAVIRQTVHRIKRTVEQSRAKLEGKLQLLKDYGL